MAIKGDLLQEIRTYYGAQVVRNEAGQEIPGILSIRAQTRIGDREAKEHIVVIQYNAKERDNVSFTTIIESPELPDGVRLCITLDTSNPQAPSFILVHDQPASYLMARGIKRLGGVNDQIGDFLACSRAISPPRLLWQRHKDLIYI